MKKQIIIFILAQNDGIEYFICYESHDKVALFGFIRLRFPSRIVIKFSIV